MMSGAKKITAMLANTKKTIHLINISDKHRKMFHMINPILTDVSLRDGIQLTSPDLMPTSKKIDIFHDILGFGAVKNIEMGSFVSPKYLPIMSDVQTFYNYGNQHLENINPVDEMRMSANKKVVEVPELFVLIPNKIKMMSAMRARIKNYSFITSVSDSFQRKNINRSLTETDTGIMNMIQHLTHMYYPSPYSIKLYISCIDHCPIEGKICNDKIVEHIVSHSWYKYTELCLSDTCGKLTFSNYKYIIDQCIDTYHIKPNNLSLHLHVNVNNLMEVEKIVRYSLDRKITKFDVSMLSDGGCAMTIEPNEINRNLDYELFYSILYRYIDERIKPTEKPSEKHSV